MLDYEDIFNNYQEYKDEPYPDYFITWDNAVRAGKSPGYYEPEKLTDIIEIYLMDDDNENAKYAIEYALKICMSDEELLCDIFMLLNDYEQWNELLSLCEQHKKTIEILSEAYKLTALLHLGMEEDAFHFFSTLKNKYAENEENLNIAYQAMSEALIRVDLFESSIAVTQEAINRIGENVDYYWLLLQSYTCMRDKDEVIKLADKIQKIDPLNDESWHNLGIAFQEINDLEKSIDAFEYAHSLNSTSQENLMKLIYVYEKNENYDKALEKVEELLNLQPKNYVVNIIGAKISSQFEKWEEALKYINNAIKIIPEMDSLYIYKSSFFMHLEEYKKAKLALEEGIEKCEDPLGSLTKELRRLNKQYPKF